VIDFRYHLVSTIAIFMALALGIVVGTTQLNDQVLDNLKSSISSLTSDKRNLETTTRKLQADVSDVDAFVTSVAADLVAGTLQGETVLVVTAPGAPSELAGELAPLLEQAGATVIGRLRLQPALLDGTRGQELDDLSTRVRPPATELPAGEPVDRAAVVLAEALVREPSDTGISEAAAETVLGGFAGEDLVDLDREQGAARRATLVVVLVPAAGEQPPTETEQVRLRSVLAVAKAFDVRSRGVVVAGPLDASREAGVLEALRKDAALSEEISGVDSVDRPLGQVLAVRALADEVRGVSGRYGSGPGAQPVVPTPAPS
jgi:Copper transport outer membrane protein, MctB